VSIVCYTYCVVLFVLPPNWIFLIIFGLFSSEVFDLTHLWVFQGSVEHLFSRNNILLISPFSLPFSLIVPLPLSSVKPICQWPDFPFLFTFLASLISIYLDLLNCLSRIPLLYLIVYLLFYLLFFFFHKFRFSPTCSVFGSE
jgi:hypothetical protein